MRVLLTMLALSLLFSCNGVKQNAAVENGGESSTASGPVLSYTLSTISANNIVVDNGDSLIVTVNLNDESGAPYVSTVPLQVTFYATGGTSRGNFTTAWDNGNGSYSAIFTGTVTGTATKIRALVNLRDIVTTYPTVSVQSPVLAWSPAGYEFGYIAIGSPSGTVDFVLSNTGNKTAATCGAPVISDTTNFSIVSDTCGTSSLAAGSSCLVQIEANPVTTGTKSATLSRSCTNTGMISTFSQRIRVSAANPVNMAWAPLTHTFADTGVGNMSSAQTFTFTNTGAGTTIGCQAPMLSDSQNFKITTDNCTGTNQATGQSCTVSVVAKPAFTGVKTATLKRTCTFGGDVTTTTNGLSYTALLPVSLSWSPLTYDFGTLVQNVKGKSITFTLTNTLTGLATGCSAPVLSNSTDFQITTDSCGTSDLASGASCKVTVQPTPQSAGTLTTTLSRTCSYDGTYSTTANGLTVTASAAQASLSWLRDPLSLGEISPAKESTVFSLYLRNAGTLPATGCTAPVLSDPVNFTLVDNCGTSDLGAYGQCEVTVKSTGPAAGPTSATLTRTCAVGGTVTTNLSVTGSTNTVSSIANGAGRAHTCALMDDNVIKCWGSNVNGQLGVGDTIDSAVPKTTLITDATNFSTNRSHTCAVLSTGDLKCWGLNSSGQLGNNSKNTAAAPNAVVDAGLSPITNAVKVATGESHSCAILSDQTVVCWGLNSSGQLGLGNKTDSLKAMPVSGLAGVTDLVAGNNHTCALAGGSIFCWGADAAGQLATNSTVVKTVPTLIDSSVLNVNDALSLSAGGNMTCALRAGGALACWGENTYGQVGDGTTTNRSVPRAITVVGVTFSQIDTGGEHTCAVTATNTTLCWGRNHLNQLGDETYANASSPRSNGMTSVSEVTTGESHTCAQFSDHSVKCWGNNPSNVRLGDGNVDVTKIPYNFITLANIIDVAQGTDFFCALDDGGSVYCMGSNGRGQLGDGTTGARTFPGAVIGITTAVEVEAGDDFACALLADSSVSCWGGNDTGSFGDGTSTSSLLPKATGLTGVTSLKLGANGGCALISGGTVKCWGQNQGDVGNGTTSAVLTPVSVLNITTATAIAKGQSHSCALLSDKTVKCWGKNNYGQLGDGTVTVATQPRNAVSGLTNIIQISSRLNSTCAVHTDKTLRCWGQNSSGQLGDGTTTDRLTPVQPALADVESISAGGTLTCASTTGGYQFCFGSYVGATQKTPQPVLGLGSVATAYAFTDPFSILSDGSFYAWGSSTPGIYSARTVNGF